MSEFIKSTDCEKLLGIKTDLKLSFDDSVWNICKKANRKLRALARTTPYINLEKREFLMNSFFHAQLIIVLWYGYFTAVRIATK